MSTISVASVIGGRDYQEDRSFVRTLGNNRAYKKHVLAVMDGHGGDRTAHLCKKALEEIFTPNIFRGYHDARRLLRRQIQRLKSLTTNCYSSGTTLSIACMMERTDEVTIAILGDSPVIVVDNLNKVHVGPEHNVITNVKEREEAVARGGLFAGGYIRNGNGGGLELSRALGDWDMGDIILREPEIYTVKHPHIIIVGSDGLLDKEPMKREWAIAEIWHMCQKGKSAKDILSRKTQPTHDNATVLLWKA
jgi:serine/threonine protein phosphatase PrpC